MGTNAAIIGNWSIPTRFLFGAGRISELPAVCRDLGISRPLLVTDRGLASHAIVTDTIARNDAAGIPTALYSDIKPNPVNLNIERGVRAYREGNYDGIIAFGGGSGLDAAKLIAFMTFQSKPIWDFEDVGENWKQANAGDIPPIIAVPTTAGTGSEAGRAAVVTNEETRTKKIIFHPKMMPSAIISDPELTVSLPPDITAATGMDALSHCLEAYCSPVYHPIADGVAVEGIRLIKDWLPQAVTDGADLEARGNMLVAASMGAVAFQKGLGAIHSMSHPVGSLFDVHHGLSNAVFMPYVLAFNMSAVEDKLKCLAAYLAFPHPSFSAVMDWILNLRQKFGIPHTLAEMGVDGDKQEIICEMAVNDPTAATNPIKLNVQNAHEIFDAAMTGRL